MFESIASFSMFKSIAYIAIGFAAAFFSLEAVWHFTACKIHDKSIKPCFYKQIRVLEWKSNMLIIGIIVGIVFVCALFMLPLHESLASPT
jgi:mannose/fructose/N-acetylgalactosamine-specific phosphotransferase system component IIC